MASLNKPEDSGRLKLLKLGMNEGTATMAIPFLWFGASTTDPYSPAIIMIVEAIQRRLATIGIRTRGDGYVDAETNAALCKISGRNWQSKPWLVIVEDVLAVRGGDDKYVCLGEYESLGAISSSTWGHTARGSCKPDGILTLMHFRALQSQANRVLDQRGRTLLEVDGIIGSKTLSAVASVLGRSAYSSCDELAAKADDVSQKIMRQANASGAVAVVKPPPAKRRAVVKRDPATGKEVIAYQPTLASIFPFDLSDPKVLLGVGAVGAAVYWMTKPTRKRTTHRRPRRRSRRRV